MSKFYGNHVSEYRTKCWKCKKQSGCGFWFMKCFDRILDCHLWSFRRYLPETCKCNHKESILYHKIFIKSEREMILLLYFLRICKQEYSCRDKEKEYKSWYSREERISIFSDFWTKERSDNKEHYKYYRRKCPYSCRSKWRRSYLSSDKRIFSYDIEAIWHTYSNHSKIEDHRNFMREECSEESEGNTHNDCHIEHYLLTKMSIERSSEYIGNHTSCQNISWNRFKSRMKWSRRICWPKKVLHSKIEKTPKGNNSKEWKKWTSHTE